MFTFTTLAPQSQGRGSYASKGNVATEAMDLDFDDSDGSLVLPGESIAAASEFMK